MKIVFKEKMVYVLLFLIVILFKCSNLLIYNFPWAGDSTLMLSGGMWFAGYDWSNYAAHGSYYGFFYPMLLSPLMRFIDEPVLLYKSMLLVNNIIVGGIALGIYYLAHERCKMCNWSSISAVMLFLVFEPICRYSDFILSEVPFMLWTLWAIIIMSKLTDTKKKNAMTLLLAIVLPLGLLIHSRCLIVYIGLLITAIVYHIVYKKSLVNYLILILIGSVEAYFINIAINYIQKAVWLSGKEVLTNSTEAMAGRISIIQHLTDLDKIKQFIVVVLSNISNYIYLSFGVFALALVTIFLLLRYYRSDIKANRSLFIILLTGILCWLGMIFSQCLISFEGVYNGDAKWLVYSRYGAPFVFLIYICMAYYLEKCELHKMQMVLLTLFVDCAAGVFFIRVLCGHLVGKDIHQTTLFNPLLTTVREYSNVMVMEKQYLYETIFLFLILTLVSIWILYKNKKMYYVVFCFLCSVLFYIRITDCWKELCDGQYKAVSASVEIAREMSNVDDENIVVIGSGTYIAEIRYGLYNRKIDIVTTTEELTISSDMIVFSSEMYDELNEGYWIFIDDRQYAYTMSDAV
ncbi:MAG: hypothetical protein IJ040_07035 [Lachnospiraceae bacterium]|nr:hypothetical protein [Lachnospiraceae bacterium]